MALGHFNVLKGAYPTLAQLDESLPVADAETGIVRGSVLRINSGEWVRTADDVASRGQTGTPGPIIYWALQDQVQPDVTMSGVLTGIPCTMPMEVETDQFLTAGTFAVGGQISAGAAGEVQDHANGETSIGIVSNGPHQRYANDAIAVTGQRTGAIINVISFWTTYSPDLTI